MACLSGPRPASFCPATPAIQAAVLVCREVRARLSALSLPAVQVLADALYGDDARVRVVAAAHILDRLYGRPAQATDLTLKAEAIDASAAHLAALVAAARRRDPRLIPPNGGMEGTAA